MDARNGYPGSARDEYTPPRRLLGPDGLPITSEKWGRDGYPLPHVLQMGAIIQSGYEVFWDRWDEARRHSRENALAMEKDCFLQSLLQERALATATLKWHVHADNERDPYQKALKDGMQRVLAATPHRTRMNYEILKGGLWYGRTANQRVYEWREISVPVVKAMPVEPGIPPPGGSFRPAPDKSSLPGGLSGGLPGAPGAVPAAVTTTEERRRSLCVRQHQPVHGDSILHKFDGTPVIMMYPPAADTLAGAQTTYSPISKAVVLTGTWRERFVVYSHESKPAEFFDYEKAEAIHGSGLRDVAYWSWWMKTEYLEWFTTFFERFGLGLRLWGYEAGNTSSYDEVFALATAASRRVNVLVPIFGGKSGQQQVGGLTSIETPIQGADAIRVMLEYFDAQMERYFVGQSMSGGADSESGLGGTGRAKFAANCVPVEGSEILTRDGFKSAAEVAVGEEVLAYDPETDLSRWTPLLDKTFFDGQEVDRLFIGQDRFEAFCTPDHSWAVERTVYASQLKGERSEEMVVGPRGAMRPVGQRRYLQKAFAIAGYENIILAAPEDGEGESLLTPTEAAVLGWVVTDGTIRRRERRRVGTRYSLAIMQSKERYFGPIRELAAAFAGGPVHEVVSPPNVRTFPFNGRTYATKAQRCWNLPTEASTDLIGKSGFRSRADLPRIVTRLSGPARRAMLEAMMMAEGCGREFANTDPDILSAFEILCALEGKATGKRRTTPTCTVKGIKSGRLVYGLKLQREGAGTADVWCPTTRYGTWVMRQNGRVMITGNTKYQLVKYDAENLADCYTSDWLRPVQRWTYPECRDIPLEYRFNVPDPDNAEKLAGVQACVSFGVDFKKDEVRALTGMSDPQPGDDIVGGVEQLAAELAADVAAEGGEEVPVSGPLSPPDAGSVARQVRRGGVARHTEEEDTGEDAYSVAREYIPMFRLGQAPSREEFNEMLAAAPLTDLSPEEAVKIHNLGLKPHLIGAGLTDPKLPEQLGMTDQKHPSWQSILHHAAKGRTTPGVLLRHEGLHSLDAAHRITANVLMNRSSPVHVIDPAAHRAAKAAAAPAPQSPAAGPPGPPSVARHTKDAQGHEHKPAGEGGGRFTGVGGGHELSKKANAATTKAAAASVQAKTLGSPEAHKAAYRSHRSAADEHFDAADALGLLAAGGHAEGPDADAQLKRMKAIVAEHEAHYSHHEGRAHEHRKAAVPKAAPKAAPKRAPAKGGKAAEWDAERVRGTFFSSVAEDAPEGALAVAAEDLNAGANIMDVAQALHDVAYNGKPYQPQVPKPGPPERHTKEPGAAALGRHRGRGDDVLRHSAYDPEQPRDDAGRWAEVAGALAAAHPHPGGSPPRAVPVIPPGTDPKLALKAPAYLAAQAAWDEHSAALHRHRIAAAVGRMLTGGHKLVRLPDEGEGVGKAKALGRIAVEEEGNAAADLGLFAESFGRHHEAVAASHPEGPAALSAAKGEAARRHALASKRVGELRAAVRGETPPEKEPNLLSRMVRQVGRVIGLLERRDKGGD